jgi:hypothetical protein
MDPITTTIVTALIQQAGGAFFAVAQRYTMERLGLSSSQPSISAVQPLLDTYLQQLRRRLDEDRNAKLLGAFSKLKDAPRSGNKREPLITAALSDFHDVSQIPERGMTGDRPNAELRCMAFIGMAASYNMSGSQLELIAEKMVEAVSADAATAKVWLGEELVREIISRFPPPEIICPKCGFRNSAGSLFCNRDGYSLIQNQKSSPQQPFQTIPSQASSDKESQVEGMISTFDLVWYYPGEISFNPLLRLDPIFRRDTGALIVRTNTLEFQGKKVKILMTSIKRILLVKHSFTDYVQVFYGDDAPKTAYFVDGHRYSRGGTKLIFDMLQKHFL